MWVARDKEGYLMFWDCDEKPSRICGNTWACYNYRGVGYLKNTDSIDVSWQDEPKEVTLVLNENIDKLLDIIEKYATYEHPRKGIEVPMFNRGRLREILTGSESTDIVSKPLYSAGDRVIVNEEGEELPGVIMSGFKTKDGYVYKVEVPLTVGDNPSLVCYNENEIISKDNSYVEK